MDSSKEEMEGDDHQQLKQREEVRKVGPKGKSCKGYLYYSSTLKSNNRNPRCIGIPRTLQQVPTYVVGQSEVETSKEGRNLTDFYYACAGYSVYTNLADDTGSKQETKSELPVCVGIELLVDRRVNHADTAPASAPAPAPAPAHTSHTDEDIHEFPQPRAHNRPVRSSGDDFLSRFTRNANLVASGVARNMRRVGNYVKESVDDVLYPYRKRPK